MMIFKNMTVLSFRKGIFRGLLLVIFWTYASAALALNAPEERVFDLQRGEWVSPEIHRIVPERYKRQIVPFVTNEPPGTIIINARQKYLYLVLPEERAVRYGIGVGRTGFEWVGVVYVKRKAEWPVWIPPQEMIERDTLAASYAEGMPGGEDNPLGARALYLYEGNKDTLYRIHGTNAPWSIGLNVSSGCIRLLNEDIIDLYNRIEIGSRVIVVMPAVIGYEHGLERPARVPAPGGILQEASGASFFELPRTQQDSSSAFATGGVQPLY